MSRVYVVKWHPEHGLPFLEPSTVRYVRVPSEDELPLELVRLVGLATVFTSRAAAERARAVLVRDLSTFAFAGLPSTPCDPGRVVVVPTTRADLQALAAWQARTEECTPMLTGDRW